jgi:hypothetical protein
MTSEPDEPALADVQREYPTWRCWRAVSGLYYARPTTAEPGDPATAKGEDPLDLRDQIRREEARTANADEDQEHGHEAR